MYIQNMIIYSSSPFNSSYMPPNIPPFIVSCLLCFLITHKMQLLPSIYEKLWEYPLEHRKPNKNHTLKEE